MKPDISSIRSTLDFLQQEGEVIEIEKEIDPIYEIAGVQKALEGGPVLLFKNIKGYPGVRNVANVYATNERLARILGVSDIKEVTFRCWEALRHPIPPRVVEEAPCQEVVITGEDIDVNSILPVIKHTERDPGRLLGSGIALLTGRYFAGGSHLSFNRANFRGKNWGSLMGVFDTHLGERLQVAHAGEIVPLTLNINTPPAVTMVAAAATVHAVVPEGSDELGFAGAIQGFPVDIVKAKTVDAYAIANAEWVIEGYIDTRERAWESEEAEQSGKYSTHPFFPEWTGYLGRANKHSKFTVTAVTHRKDPIFVTNFARSIESDIISSKFREACFLELAHRIYPGLVVNINTIIGVAGWAANIVFQVHKTKKRQEGNQKRILAASLEASPSLQLAIAVDEDIDIYTPEDILWAIATRVNPAVDLIITRSGGVRNFMLPAARKVGPETLAMYDYVPALGIDATIPLELKWNYERAHYPVDRINLEDFIRPEKIAEIRLKQSPYARLLSKTGW